MAGAAEPLRAGTAGLRARLLRWRPPRVAQGLTAAALAAHFAVWGLQAPWGRAPLAGTLLAAAGLGWMTWAWALFRRVRTPICPTARPEVFITTGPYRTGRNSMYVGMTLALLGFALALGMPPLAVAAVAFIVIVALVHVPHEEARMRAQFGSRFEDYVAATRRWL